MADSSPRHYRLLCGVTALLLAAAGRPARAWIVCLDPGHGGPGAAKWNGDNGDGAGAVGPSGLTEEWVNLEIARDLEEMLAGEYDVVLTRREETEAVSLMRRVAIAGGDNPLGAPVDALVSIHHNGFPEGGQGTETWWCRDQEAEGGRGLADALQPRLVEAFGYADRGVRDDLEGRGFHFTVLYRAAMAAVLTEASNISSNAQEESLMADDAGHRRAEAAGVRAGIAGYFGDVGVGDLVVWLPPLTDDPSGITLRWHAERGPGNEWEAFEVGRSDDGGASYTLVGVVPYEGAQEYTLRDAAVYTNHRYFYLLVTDEEVGPFEVPYFLEGYPGPPLPRAPALELGWAGEGYVRLVAHAEGDWVLRYIVHYDSDGPGPPYSLEQSFDASEPLVIPVPDDAPAFCVAQAENFTGRGPLSMLLTVVPAPDGLVATGGDGAASLRWETVAQASLYRIYRGMVFGFPRSPESLVGEGAGAVWRDEPLVNARIYYYRVSAVTP